MQLQKVQSIECPSCGCNATRIVGAGELHGHAWARFACDFCRNEFVIGRQPTGGEVVNGVVYHRTRCPKCRSKNNYVDKTKGRIRYHHCRNCSQRFKSVEV